MRQIINSAHKVPVFIIVALFIAIIGVMFLNPEIQNNLQTSRWSEYQNPDLGFSFKYPTNMALGDIATIIKPEVGPQEVVVQVTNEEELSTNLYITVGYRGPAFERAPKNIRYTLEERAKRLTVTFEMFKNDGREEVDEESKKTLEQIIKSFKFNK